MLLLFSVEMSFVGFSLSFSFYERFVSTPRELTVIVQPVEVFYREPHTRPINFAFVLMRNNGTHYDVWTEVKNDQSCNAHLWPFQDRIGLFGLFGILMAVINKCAKTPAAQSFKFKQKSVIFILAAVTIILLCFVSPFFRQWPSQFLASASSLQTCGIWRPAKYRKMYKKNQ